MTTNVSNPSRTRPGEADEQLLLLIGRWADLTPTRRAMILKLADPPAEPRT